MISLMIINMSIRPMPGSASKSERLFPVVTWAGGTPIHRAPLALARRFAQICTAVVAEALAGEDLTPLQYAMLANLNDDPVVDQIGIAERLGIDRNSKGILVRQFAPRRLVKQPTNRTARPQQ